MLENSGLEIVGDIYESAHDATRWNDVLISVADFCGCENVALAVIDQHAGRSTVMAPRADPATISAYERNWWQLDPTAAATASKAVGQITSLEDTGRDLFLASPFYNDFWRRSGLGAARLASNLAVRDGFFASVVLQTSPKRDRISNMMKRRFGLLLPHLIRSVEMSRRFGELQYEAFVGNLDTSPMLIGRLVVDGEMRLVFADAGGEEFLARSNCITVARGAIGLIDRAAHAALTQAVGGSAASWIGKSDSDQIKVICRHWTKPVVIDVQSARTVHPALGLPGMIGGQPTVILTLRYHQDPKEVLADVLKARFGLTQAECALAIEMLAGDGRAAAAQRRRISINTARTHLTRIFDKTGVKRQAELIALMNEAI